MTSTQDPPHRYYPDIRVTTMTQWEEPDDAPPASGGGAGNVIRTPTSLVAPIVVRGGAAKEFPAVAPVQQQPQQQPSSINIRTVRQPATMMQPYSPSDTGGASLHRNVPPPKPTQQHSQFTTEDHEFNQQYQQTNTILVSVLIVLIGLFVGILVYLLVPLIMQCFRAKMASSQRRIRRRYETIEGWLISKVCVRVCAYVCMHAFCWFAG